MGLRTELAIDGDRCRSCGRLLAQHGIALSRHLVLEDDMIITMAPMLCRRCYAVTDISYWGELLPPEPKSPLEEKPCRVLRFACAPTVER